MSKGVQGAVLRLLHAETFRLRVKSTMLECGGLMKRITFSSPDELPAVLFEPAAWIRLWFRTSEGREVQRAYTVAGYAPDRSTIDVSFYLHQTSGPAAAWAQRVRSGAMLDVSLLGSRPFHLDEWARGVVLLGDETAFPAVRAILASLPDDIEARVLLTGEHDLSAFVPTRRRTDVRYLPVQRATHGFERMLRELDDSRIRDHAADNRVAADELWHCWAAGESSMMRAVRAAAKRSNVLCEQKPSTRSYWSRHRVI